MGTTEFLKAKHKVKLITHLLLLRHLIAQAVTIGKEGGEPWDFKNIA